MSRFPGNIIKLPNVTPTQSSASGVWSLKDQMVYQRNNLWPFQRDPYFNYTTLFLQGNVPNTTGPQAMNLPLSYNADASTNNFLVTPNGDVGPRPFSPYFGGNYSVYFDGSASLDYADNANLEPGSGDFTFETWAYHTSSPGAAVYYGQQSGGLAIYRTSTGGIGVDQAGVATIITETATKIPLNTWTHVAIVRSGTSSGNIKVYFNGFVDGVTGTSNANFNGSSTAIGIGKLQTNFMIGYLSNVRFCKAAVYTTNFTPSTSPFTTTSQGATNCNLLICQSNRFIDNSGNGFTNTTTGSPRITDNSPFVSTDFTTGAGYFKGSGDYLSVPSSTAFGYGTGDFTIECWVYPLASTAQRLVFGGGDLNNLDIGFNPANTFQYYDGTVRDTGVSAASRQWFHFAVSRTSGTTSVYINGTRTNNFPDTSNSSARQYFVAGSNVGGNPFNGYINDVRIIKGQGIYSGTTITIPNAPLTTTGYGSTSQNITGTVSLLTLQTRAPSQNINFIDSSPNEFIVTKNGNTTQGTFSPFSPTGWSNQFNGTALILPSSSALNAGTGNFTIEAWVYPISGGYLTGTTNGVLLFAPSSDDGFIRLGRENQAFDVSVNAGLVKNRWQHVAISRSGTTVYVFLDGILKGTGSSSQSYTLSSAYIGMGGTNYVGYASNFRFVVGTALYTADFPVPTAPLTAVSGTALLTCQSNRFRDNSPNNFTFTTSGSPSVQAFSPFAPANAVSPLVTGGSGYFDGTGDYLNTPTGQTQLTLGTDSFTIEGWFYAPTQVRSNGTIFASNSSTTYTNAILFQLSSSAATAAELAMGGSILKTSIAVVPNQWNHFVIQRTAPSTMQMWMNGNEVTGVSGSSANLSDNGWRIGFWAVTGNDFTGYISDFRITKGSALYSGSVIPVPTAPLRAASNTSLLLNFTNGAAVDATGKNVVESVGTAQLSTKVTKFAGTGSGYFDASVAYQTIPNTAGLIALPGDFTLELWAYRLDATNNTYFCVFGNQAAGNNGFLFWVTGGSANAIRFYSNGAFVMSGANNAVPLNQWTHIALVRSGTAANNMRCYIDGVEDTAARATNTTAFVGVSGNGLAIGTEYSGSFSGTRAAFYYSNYRLTKYARYTANFNTNLPTGPFPIG